MSIGDDKGALNRPRVRALAISDEDLQSDSKATAEANAIASGSLDEEAQENAHGRRENFRDHFHKAEVVLFWGATTSIFLLAATWVWHLLGPPACHWLEQPKVDIIQTFLISSLATVFASNYAKKNYLGD